MADKNKTKKTKEEKKKEKAEKKALKKEAKEAKKQAKTAAKLEKKNKKDSKGPKDHEDPKEKSEVKSDTPKKKSFFTIKKLIIIPVVIILIAGLSFFVYKMFFSSSDDELIVYKSITLKKIDLPEEMLKFSFDHINDLYFSFVTYDLRIHLLNIEINRINKIGESYPEQNKIAEKEKKDWIKAKEKVEKKFIKIQKEIRELYVLYKVNKKEGIQKIKEKNKDLLLQANEALETLEPYITIIETTKQKAPQGLINNTLHKIKKIL